MILRTTERAGWNPWQVNPAEDRITESGGVKRPMLHRDGCCVNVPTEENAAEYITLLRFFAVGKIGRQ